MDKKGNASISTVIVMLFIMLLIVLPLISIVFENYYISIISREIVDASYSSMSSTFDSINIARSTKDSLDYGSELEARFKEFLSYNLLLDESLQSQKDKFSKLQVMNFVSLPRGSSDKITGINMERQTIHVEMKVEFEAMFLMSAVGDKRIVDIHFDYEVPIDN